jgi:hypothetical protein
MSAWQGKGGRIRATRQEKRIRQLCIRLNSHVLKESHSQRQRLEVLILQNLFNAYSSYITEFLKIQLLEMVYRIKILAQQKISIGVTL